MPPRAPQANTGTYAHGQAVMFVHSNQESKQILGFRQGWLVLVMVVIVEVVVRWVAMAKRDLTGEFGFTEDRMENSRR